MNRAKRSGSAAKSVRKHLQRDVAIEPRVPRPIHFAHAASPKQREDLVRAEAATGVQGQTVTGLYGREGSADGILLINAALNINPCPAGVGWPDSPRDAAPESTTTTESSDGGRRWCCRRGSHPGIETSRGFPLHRFIHDRAAPIDRLRLVTDDRHGDRSRHAGALERPDGRPTHVMHQGARTARRLARVLPRGPEVAEPSMSDDPYPLNMRDEVSDEGFRPVGRDGTRQDRSPTCWWNWKAPVIRSVRERDDPQPTRD